MRREFIDESAIAADVQTVNDAIGRVVNAWMEAITQRERERVKALVDGGMRFGMVVLLEGDDTPPRAEIVGVAEDGEVLGLAELTYTSPHRPVTRATRRRPPPRRPQSDRAAAVFAAARAARR